MEEKNENVIDARMIFQVMREIAEFDRKNGPLTMDEEIQLKIELADLEAEKRIDKRRVALELRLNTVRVDSNSFGDVF